MANEFKVRKGLIVQGSGSTGDETILDVQGNQGQLFSITDSLIGDIFTVSDISGIPILNVSSSGIVEAGTFGSYGLIVNGSNITSSGNISSSGNLIGNNLEVNGSITASGVIMGDTNVITLGDPDANVGGVRAIINQNGTTQLLGNATLDLKGNTINIDSDAGGTAAINLLSPVTASGNISSSGVLQITNITGSGDIAINGFSSVSASLAAAVAGGGVTSITAGEGIDVDQSTGAVEVSGEDATTSNKGIAKFNTTNFSVNSGDVTIKTGGVDLTDEVTGTLPVANGGTNATSFADKSVIITQDSGTDTLAAVAMSTNGQLLIGGTSGPAVAVPTGGDGLTVTVGDGSLEYDLDAALTTVTSILNSSLVVGRDSTDQIKFSTDNQIIFRVGNADGVTFKASGEIEATSLDISDGVDIAGVLTLGTALAVAEGGTGATSFADKSVIITQDSGTDTLAAVAMSTNGQLLIGGTSGPSVATITEGHNISITNGNGSISIAATTSSLNGSGAISASVLDSPAQGQVRLTTNGVAASAIDLGLETGDSPSFTNITASNGIGAVKRSKFGFASGQAFQASHQFKGISGDTNFFLIFDEDGEEVMKGVGSAAGGNLTYQFGDNGTAANGTFFEVADGTNNGQFKLRNDGNNAKVGINIISPENVPGLEVVGRIKATNITASGNITGSSISASGKIFTSGTVEGTTVQAGVVAASVSVASTGFVQSGTNTTVGSYLTVGTHITASGNGTISGCLGVGTAVPSTTNGLIRATNDVIAFYSSDERLKNNISELSGSVDKINQIRGVEFDWIPKEGIHENEGHDIGVIAQEIEKVFPEVVQTRENGYKAVKYDKLTAVLISAIKELKAEIEELKKK
jgi:hypothetical protein